MSSALPATFGRYTLLKRIATGGMAEIFLARQQGPGRFERSLVIKRILPHLIEDAQFTAMFLDEAALAAQLSHPHIAQVYDFGQEDGAYFIAMELVRGPDLRRVINASRELGRHIPIPIAVRVASHVLAALDSAHRAMSERGEPLKVVHRDVSPGNVLISTEGVVKLVDFGIAKAADASHETAVGVVKGKFAYLAPEQLGRNRLDGRCDLYATALVLYELLTLEKANVGEGPAAIRAVAEAQHAPVTDLRPEVPPELVKALNWALQKFPDDRPPDCRTFQHELDQMLMNWGELVTNEDVAKFIRGLEVEWGKPLSTIGTGNISTANKLPEPVAPEPEKLVTKKLPALVVAGDRDDDDDDDEDTHFDDDGDEVTALPTPLTSKRRESSAPKSVAPVARVARPIENEPPMPLTAKRNSGVYPRVPPPPDIEHLDPSVRRSTLQPSSGRGRLIFGILAAVLLAAIGFFAVKLAFGTGASAATVEAPGSSAP